MNFKEIHIGKLIKIKVEELEINEDRISNFFKLPITEIRLMYDSQNISTDHLLRWCKLLEYDFFRLYSHHLILYAPLSAKSNSKETKSSSSLPVFRKNIYSRELISFILEQIESGEMTKNQVITEYRIPKSTLNKWSLKYSENRSSSEL
ncbi:transposase [Chryseobacterium lactis]|uniref:Transposase n=1 Tax=Chryseobacterium lactis TaxID=1241981 RepID=A0A3G6RIF9_CHRLC|nr:transposase [Chryseobacterium lactis]AZA82628.1 transposase [Chryseobacterium lactis]AZB03009.1 transposase [Chryseobacterium lactis]PNW11851.1 transposase [Chryseobacterium lactis]